MKKLSSCIPMGGFSAAAALLVLALAACYMPAAEDPGPSGSLSLAVAAPKAVTGGTVRVSGGDMGTVTAAILPGETSKTLEVPAGAERTVEVFLKTLSATVGGSALVDVVEDAVTSVTVPITSLVDTAILIPDRNNYRLVQIDDMSGAGWLEDYYDSFPYGGYSSEFTPSDADFDSGGRMYIANNAYSYSVPGIVRIADIASGWTAETIVGVNIMVNDLIIYRPGNLLYYMTGGMIYRVDISAAPPYTPVMVYDTYTAGFSNPAGLAVDDSGILYTTAVDGTYVNFYILQIDPAAGSLIGTKNVLPDPADICVKGSSIFVLYGISGPAIEVYGLNAGLITGLMYQYGAVVGAYAAAPGEFFRPRRFAAVTKKRLYIIDSDDYDYDGQRVVSLDPNDWSWETYGYYGSGVGQFRFYSVC